MSNTIEIAGVVEKVFETQTFDSGFQKRILVINTGGDYPQMIPVEFVKDKCDILDGLVKGQQVVAAVNIKGNEYKGKYYANIQGWRLEVGEKPGRQAPIKTFDNDDDIPFG